MIEKYINEFFEEVRKNDLTDFFHMSNYSVFKDDDEYVIKFTIPGADKDKIKLSVDGELLKLSVEKTDVFNGIKENLWLSPEISVESISAKYKDGILTITMPFMKDNKNRTDIVIE